MSLEYASKNIVQAEEQITQLEMKLKALRASLNLALDTYMKEWDRVFKAKLEDSGLTWCTWCGMIMLQDKAKECWDLYSKSDNYGPVMAHTATKHRCCSVCAETLSSPEEATSFGAMFVKDGTHSLPSEKTQAQLEELFELPRRNPLTN